MKKTNKFNRISQLTLSTLLMITMVVNLSAAVKVGSPAPDFKMLDQDEKVHTLADYKGQKVVVYFYPKDDTPGCTKEACSIRDDYGLFEKGGIKVFGVSYDDSQSHKTFADKYDLPFTLLSDTDKSVSKAYGANGLFMAQRKTFLIDESGILRKIYENVTVTGHGAEILADFEALAKD
jgi:peroxiredoxin Q/BCP